MGTDGDSRSDDGRRDTDGRGDGSGTGGSMHERADQSRLLLYVLLEADRWIVTAGVLALVFVLLVAAGTLAPVALRSLVSQADPVGTLFQALVTAIITGVTVVVTITQLVLSQELGPLGDQRERMDGTMDVRTDAADLIDAPVSPLEPAGFLRALLEASRTRVERLDAALERVGEPARSRIETFVDGTSTDAAVAADRLADAEFGTFEALSPALDFNYSVKLYDARRLRAEHGDELTDEAGDALDEVVDALALFAPVREHVKTLYFQWELTNLSREILYVTIPALVVAMVGVVYLDTAGMIQGTTVGIDNFLLAVSAAATVAVAPFALFLAYVLRVVTVAKRTLAIGPFVLRNVNRSGGVDWDDGD